MKIKCLIKLFFIVVGCTPFIIANHENESQKKWEEADTEKIEKVKKNIIFYLNWIIEIKRENHSFSLKYYAEAVEAFEEKGDKKKALHLRKILEECKKKKSEIESIQTASITLKLKEKDQQISNEYKNNKNIKNFMFSEYRIMVDHLQYIQSDLEMRLTEFNKSYQFDPYKYFIKINENKDKEKSEKNISEAENMAKFVILLLKGKNQIPSIPKKSQIEDFEKLATIFESTVGKENTEYVRFLFNKYIKNITDYQNELNQKKTKIIEEIQKKDIKGVEDLLYENTVKVLQDISNHLTRNLIEVAFPSIKEEY